MPLDNLKHIIKNRHPEADLAMVELAYEFAAKMHAGQMRLSGEPYIEHSLATAVRLAEMDMDLPTIIAGLLHDVSEDAGVQIEELKMEFGDEIAGLVDGVTKLGKIKYRGIQRYAENLRKMFVAIAEDVRVIFIKFADRTHNLKTLDAVPLAKRKRIAQESMEIYAPIADRLGMGELRGELEDLSFPYVYPEEYAWLKEIIIQPMEARKKIIGEVVEEMKGILEKNNIRGFHIHGRAKRMFSLYKKLLYKDRDIEKIHDLIAVRILVKEVEDCYQILGIIHSRWRPMPRRIKDYIAQPKPNGYQSLHTTVFTDSGHMVEFQICTEEMHDFAEQGIAAHWFMKEKGHGKKVDQEHQIWLESLVKLQKETISDEDYLEKLKLTLFNDRIFVFTPEGDVINLPESSTPIDFAYSIHTELGDHAGSAYVNDRIVSLDTRLWSGDVVEIREDKSKKGPSEDWLKFARTKTARTKIQEYCRRQRRRRILKLFFPNK